MKIFSFYRDNLELEPVEIEVQLLPGLPTFEVLGLADSSIKESLGRVRSALHSAKYFLPQRQKVVFNLKPAYQRKRSEGLDLALAISYLKATEQIHLEKWPKEDLFIYGELGLDGSVSSSRELEFLLKAPKSGALLTGPAQYLPFAHYEINNLATFDSMAYKAEPHLQALERPNLQDIHFSQKAARLMAVVATGEHSLLLAGPSGSGKSTWVNSLHTVLKNLCLDDQKQVCRIAKLMGREPEWRPLVAPHHTIPTLSLIGGGSPPFPGEMTRAHGGLLFLDEFLEFSPIAKEALREPLESGEITVARKGKVHKFPARSLVIAATNLCPCGDWVPQYKRACRYSLIRCRSYLEKLSGPLLDRFEILALSHIWKGDKNILLSEIYAQVCRAQNFAFQQRGQRLVNSRVDSKELIGQVDKIAKALYSGLGGSMRRDQALLRVARSIADLEGEPLIGRTHLAEALDLTWSHFQSIRQGMH